MSGVNKGKAKKAHLKASKVLALTVTGTRKLALSCLS